MVGGSGTEGCCNEVRSSVGRGAGVLSWSIAVAEEVTEEVNEAPRGGTSKGGLDGCGNL